MRRIIPYNSKLVERARELRNNMTIGEISLWREIKGKKLGYRFSRQIPIDQYIVDFYCKELNLAIEIDGSIHFLPSQSENDKKRQERLESLGVIVIRFIDSDAKYNLKWVLSEIRKEISRLENA